MYTSVIRPLLFLGEAERIHGMLVSFLCFYRYLFPFRKWVRRYYRVNGREFSWNGLTFKNRIGLSAGFDKGGECFDELADFGFGFIELGTLTPQFQAGNPRPRIFRLPADSVLISRTGFNNPGMDGLAWNICRRGTEHRYLLGININRDPQSEGEAAVNDFLRLFIRFYEESDYFTLNWGALPAEWFEKVLKALDAYRRSQAVHRFMRVKLLRIYRRRSWKK